MIHGGDTLTYKDHYDGELIDFSSNINPLGTPEGLHEKLIEGFETLTAYPDIEYRKLKDSIAEYLDCAYENVLVGNGAMEIIDNFIMIGKRVVTTMPAFAEYSLRAKAHGKELKQIPYKDDFNIDIKVIRDTIKKDDLLVLGNPNNPTGLRIEKNTLLELYNMVSEREAYLLLDEAFHEFVPYDYDSIQLFKGYNYKNVGIIRAATKFFALPGIRLGYACAAEDKVEEIEDIQLPWSINALGDIAGQYIFRDKEYIERSKEYIENERQYISKELSKISWLKTYPTQTNFQLIKLNKLDEDYLFKYFLSRGIVIRKCSSFLGLDKQYIRIAIRSRKDNEKLINIFKELTKEVEDK